MPISQHLKRIDAEKSDCYPARLDPEENLRSRISHCERQKDRKVHRIGAKIAAALNSDKAQDRKQDRNRQNQDRIQPGKGSPTDELLHIAAKEGQQYKLNERENLRPVDEGIRDKLPEMKLSNGRLGRKCEDLKKPLGAGSQRQRP